MKTINQEDYGKLNKSLYQLEDLLAQMGIKEFSITKETRKIEIELDTDTTDLNTKLIDDFCNNIDKMYMNNGCVHRSSIRP